MIEVDGGMGEAGGQVLRTALGLSAVTGKPFKIIKIRAKRPTAGLRQQHLQAVNAMARLCNAEVEGAKLQSTELTFKPKEISSGRLKINILTAGSVGLVLQAMLIPAMRTKLKIKIEGGATYGKWAVPMDHLKYVVFPLVSKMGYDIEVEDLKEGFFPKGGARVAVDSSRMKEMKGIDLLDKGKIVKIEGRSVASKHLERARVAERQANGAKRILSESFGIVPEIKTEYHNSLCAGSGIQLWIKTENSIIGANGLGERGKKAEDVGKEAAKKLINEYDRGVVDSHTADQLLPYFALSGGGNLKTSYITNHVITNARVIEKFLDVKFEIKDKIITCKKM